ncbi:FmdB family zinc ribbon protein [Terriglobus saanensis]|nr:zinc ribbon domain-containing protein [Terriglobus saanensis]
MYEYECTQCHKHTEKRQKFSDPEITQCPHCGGLLERVISAPAVMFKGGGWYADLYSSSKKTPKTPATGEGSSTPAASGSSEGAAPAAAATATPAATAAPVSSSTSSSSSDK